MPYLHISRSFHVLVTAYDFRVPTIDRRRDIICVALDVRVSLVQGCLWTVTYEDPSSRFPFRVCEIAAEKKYRPWRDKAPRGCIIDLRFLSLSRHRIVYLIFSGVENTTGGDKKYRHVRLLIFQLVRASPFNSYLSLSIAKYIRNFLYFKRVLNSYYLNAFILRWIESSNNRNRPSRWTSLDVQRCVSLKDAIPRKAANFCEIKSRAGRFVHIPSNCPRKSHKQTELPESGGTLVVGDQQLPIEKVSFEVAILVFETSHVRKNQFQEGTHSRSVVQFRIERIEFFDQLANEALFAMKFLFVRGGSMFTGISRSSLFPARPASRLKR